MTATAPRSGAQAVERALAVLRCVAAEDSGVGITELATQMGLSVSTAHRLARTLTDNGLLLQHPRTEPAAAVRTGDWQLGAMYTSAMGKCLLAHSGDLDEAIRRLGELAKATHRTITDRDQLHDELRLVRERGWALNDEERNPGVRAIAARCSIRATVRITDDRLPELAALTDKATHRVAQVLAIGR